MRSIFINKHGDIEDLKVGELKTPNLSPNEVLIRTKFAALNHIDIFLINGWPGLNLKMPHILGSDGSGIIEEVGSEVTTIKKGDRVTVNPGLSCGKCKWCISGQQIFCKEFSIMGENRWGTFAEFFKVPEINVIKCPSNFSLAKAAAAPLTFLTAYRSLVTRAKIKKNEFILIHGAGGGVSSAAIQIAKYIGAKIITTTSTNEKMQKAEDLGADYVFNYKENPDFGKIVYKEVTKKHGVDVVLDSVGKSTFSNSLRLLKPGGRLVTPGSTTGHLTEIDIRQIFWKQLIIKGSTMGNQGEFREVMDLIFRSKLNPIIDKIYHFEDIIEAEKYLNQGNQFGKLLIDLS